jgi:hypothetical protein
MVSSSLCLNGSSERLRLIPEFIPTYASVDDAHQGVKYGSVYRHWQSQALSLQDDSAIQVTDLGARPPLRQIHQ